MNIDDLQLELQEIFEQVRNEGRIPEQGGEEIKVTMVEVEKAETAGRGERSDVVPTAVQNPSDIFEEPVKPSDSVSFQLSNM